MLLCAKRQTGTKKKAKTHHGVPGLVSEDFPLNFMALLRLRLICMSRRDNKIDSAAAASTFPQFFEFKVRSESLALSVVESREGRENRPQSRCGIEQQTSMHRVLVQELGAAKPIGQPVKAEVRQA
jgi:hypothetical protein